MYLYPKMVVNDYIANSQKGKLVQQWIYVHTEIEYNCSQMFVISMVVKLDKTLN